MKNTLLTLSYFIITALTFGQVISPEYYNLVAKAESLYIAKNYKASAFSFSAAFGSNHGDGTVYNKFDAACAWTLANYPDSAFFTLEEIVAKYNFNEYEDVHISTNSNLNPLHNDKRWKSLLETIKRNEDKAERSLNKPLAAELDSIYTEDQKYRLMIDSIRKRSGQDSKEMKDLWKIINEKDSINLVKTTTILDKYGWLGTDVVGVKGNAALFLVIQHSKLKIQEHYLPMMKEAVKNGKALGSQLALLVDRIEMRNERPQIYGSQLQMKDGKYGFYQIVDEINVNKRRAEVGLQPLEEYARYFNIEYKLPSK